MYIATEEAKVAAGATGVCGLVT